MDDPITRAAEDAADAHGKAADAHERAREAHEDAADGHETVADADREDGAPAVAAVDEEHAAGEHERAAGQAWKRGEQDEKAIAADPRTSDPPS